MQYTLLRNISKFREHEGRQESGDRMQTENQTARSKYQKAVVGYSLLVIRGKTASAKNQQQRTKNQLQVTGYSLLVIRQELRTNNQ
jgi:hypothetical protein